MIVFANPGMSVAAKEVGLRARCMTLSLQADNVHLGLWKRRLADALVLRFSMHFLSPQVKEGVRQDD